MSSRWLVSMIGALPLVLMSAGCQPGERADSSQEGAAALASVEDRSGARRIVSLSRMASLMLVELAVTDRIVGVDGTSSGILKLQRRARIPAAAAAALEAIDDLAADLVIVPAARRELGERLRVDGVEVRVVEVHDFDDGFELSRELALAIGMDSKGHAQIREITRPLAELSAASLGRSRPRVAAIAGIDPVRLVGGHAFETALIEIAGGENVTHGRDEPTIVVGLAALRALEPELVVRVTPEPLSDAARAAIEDALSGLAPIVFLDFDRDRFYGPQAIAAAERLHARIRARSLPLPTGSN